MDEYFQALSNGVFKGNVAPDHLKLAFSIISTYPCAILFKHLPNPTLKHLFSISYTTVIMLGVLKLYHGYLHIVTICLTSYALMKFYRGPKVQWINFALVMASMSLCHIGRQMKGTEGDTELDFSGALMIITIKLSSYGFNILDGAANSKGLTKHQEEMKIVQYPSVLQYFGWCFYFAGFLAGPTCEYMDYLRLTENNERVSPANEWKPAMKTLLKSCVFIGLLVTLAPTFNYFQALEPQWQHKSFWYKMAFIQISAVLTRCKYYFVWTLAEGACILSGFGFNGYSQDGQPLWNKLTNVHVIDCEFAQSYKQLTANWNIGANHWLREYVYLRFNPPGSSKSTFYTYIISSLWHGFHPGFYLFFMIAGTLQVISRDVRRTVRPFFITNKPLKRVYDISTWLISMGLLNMLVPCFDLLHVPKILVLWRQIYYCHLIMIVIGCSLFYMTKPYFIAQQRKQGIYIVKKKPVIVQGVVDSLAVDKKEL